MRGSCRVNQILCGRFAWPLVVIALASAASSEPRDEAPAEVTHDDALPEGAVFRLGTTRFRQEGEVAQVRYSRDGKKLATISRDAVILWDARSGKELRRLRHRSDAAYMTRLMTLAFSPDGDEIAAADTSRVYIWEVGTGLELLSFPIEAEPVFQHLHIQYSPDGEKLAVTAELNVLLYDTTTGARTDKLMAEDHRAVFTGLCWTPDGTHLLASTLHPAVVAWHVESGKLVRRFEGQDANAFANGPTMSTDGKTLLAATGAIVDLWDFASGDHLKSIVLDADYIHTLVLSADNKTVIVGSQDGMIRVVDVESGKLRRKIDGRLWIGRSLAVSPDFNTVAIGAVFPTIRQWNIETGEELYPELTSAGHNAEVRCVAWSPDGRLIASGAADHQINLWDAESGQLRRTISTPSSTHWIGFTPSGRQLLTSWKHAGMIRVWDVASGEQVRTIQSGMKKVRTFVLTGDGQCLIAVVSDAPYEWSSLVGEERLQVWDFATGEKLREFSFKTASAESAVLTVDGAALVIGSGNGVIHVIDIWSGSETATLLGHSHSVGSLALSGDGRLLASGSTDQTIRLWDTKTWKSVRVLKGHRRSVTSVAFSPDSAFLASGSGTDSYPLSPGIPQRIRFWDVRSGEQVGQFSGHDRNTAAVAFSPDGKRLVSAHNNTTLLLWDVGAPSFNR